MDGQITQVAITLSGILLLIVTLGFVAKRANKSGLLGTGAIRVVTSLNLGVKEKLVLIEVGEEQLLIAVSAVGISKIHMLAAPLQLDSNTKSGSVAPPLFEDQLSSGQSSVVEPNIKKSFRQQFEKLIKQ